ncbi:MAG: aldehyde ferredoxin oxidoreductase C-terminal domain-containing protein [Promethearchaeota archaeon]
MYLPFKFSLNFRQDHETEKLSLYGERIFMMKRIFNLKMGVTPKDDKLPKILLNPLEGTESVGKTPNFERLK